MQQNPFTSSRFGTIWSKHFNQGKPIYAFDFIKGVKFVKKSLPGLYVNVGKNLTKGINYDLYTEHDDYKGKTFLIYDVPSYFNIKPFEGQSGTALKLKSIFQYHGFLMDISNYENHESYIKDQFSSKNRREFRSNQRRLETCFEIRYEFIHEAIAPEKFDMLFDQFYKLLTERFQDKKVNYHHLSQHKWAFYSELVFEMLKERKASLLVIYKKDQPIGITLNFHAESVLFETITVFDPDYYKFSIGKTSIIKLLEWCFDNNYRVSDFSKGYFEYKHKWSNLTYDFNYHILYDSKSIRSKIVANMVSRFFKLKLYLRTKNVNEFYRKLKFLFSGSKTNTKSALTKVKFDKLMDFRPDHNTTEIDHNEPQYDFLLQYVYTFLFANPEPEINIKVFKDQNDNSYIITGSKMAQRVSLY